MRILHLASVELQEGAGEASLLTRGGSVNYKTITQYLAQTIVLAALSEDTSIPMTAITEVSVLHVDSDQDINIKLFGVDGSAIPIKAYFPFSIVLATPLTEIFIANLGASEAKVQVLIGG
jgi:hypothetical protein